MPSSVCGGQIAQGREFDQPGTAAFEFLPVAGHELFGRTHDHHALIAVDDDQVAADHLRQQLARADDGRQFQALGQNRRVSPFAAGFGDESAHPAAIEPGGLAGRQVVGQHDGGSVQIQQALMAAVQQVIEQPLFQIVQVVCPLRQEIVRHVLEHAGVAAQRLMHRQLRRHVLVANQTLQLLAQMGVAQHLVMGREDGAVLVTQLRRDGLAIALDLRRTASIA